MNQCRLAMSIQYRENNIDTATFPYWFGFKNNKKFYWHVYLQTHSPTHTDLRIDTHIDTHTQTHIQTHIHTQTRTHTHTISYNCGEFTQKRILEGSWGLEPRTPPPHPRPIPADQQAFDWGVQDLRRVLNSFVFGCWLSLNIIHQL